MNIVAGSLQQQQQRHQSSTIIRVLMSYGCPNVPLFERLSLVPSLCVCTCVVCGDGDDVADAMRSMLIVHAPSAHKLCTNVGGNIRHIYSCTPCMNVCASSLRAHFALCIVSGASLSIPYVCVCVIRLHALCDMLHARAQNQHNKWCTFAHSSHCLAVHRYYTRSFICTI